MLGKLAHPIQALAVKNFLAVMRSPRTVTTSLILLALLILTSWALGTIAATPPEDEGGTRPLWQRGPDGVLTTLAFAILPVFLPLVPVAVVGKNLTSDRESGFHELVVSKPVPRWGLVIGKFLGLFGAVAAVLVPVSLAGAYSLQFMTGTPASGGLLIAFVAASMVLGALYILLALLIGVTLGPRSIPPLVFLAWIAFHAVRPTSFVLLGQILAIVSTQTPPSFSYVWLDAFSFTGIFQGLFATAIPENLGFVVASGAAGIVEAAVLWAALPWGALLLLLHVWYLEHIPAH